MTTARDRQRCGHLQAGRHVLHACWGGGGQDRKWDFVSYFAGDYVNLGRIVSAIKTSPVGSEAFEKIEY